jgi:hypothetical protein
MAAILSTVGVGLAIAGAPVKPNTLAATNITTNSATLNGHVFPDQSVTTYYYFQYGTTTDYGTQTGTEGPVNGTDKDVSTAVAGLAPSTTYHYRVVATNTDGTTVGDDKTFTTAAPGTSTPGNSSNAVTLKATPTTVIFGRSTTLSGKLTGPNNSGVKLTVEQNAYPFTGGFKATTVSAVTDTNGSFSVSLVPLVNSHYRVSAKTQPPVTSPEVTVNVRVKVGFRLSDSTPRRGQSVRFSGTVTPAHNGKVALIQRRTATGSWRTIARTSLVATTPVNGIARSKYAKRIRVFRNGTFRVRVSPADGNHVTGYSARRTARVH